MIRLKNLVESLEKKYSVYQPRTLNESYILNEKLSDDMPDWFAKRLLTTKYSSEGDPWYRDVGGKAHFSSPYNNNNDYIRGKGSKKNPNFGKEPAYKQLEWGGSDQSLFTGLRNKGIRMDTVKIIEGPVPISDTDPRLQSPNLPIFLFDNGVVYIPGINDDEKLGGRKSLGAYKISALLPQCKKFAYIDGSDTDNFFTENERSARRSSREGSIYRAGVGEKDRNGNFLGGDTNWRSDIDKSGYRVIPPMEKYKDKLDEIKANKIYDILKGYEDYLTDVQQEISNYILSVPMREYGSGIKRDVELMNRKLHSAIEYYIATERCLNEILNDRDLSPEAKKSKLLDLLNGRNDYYYSGGVDDLERSIQDLKDYTKDKFNASIDWI